MINLLKIRNQRIQNSEGFTIIECLIAIIVVGIFLISIAPVLVLSAGTRVQAKRVEQATQATNTFIDAVRTGVITPSTNITLTAISSSSDRTSDNLITTTNMPVPTSSTKTALYCYNSDRTLVSPGASGCTSNLFYIQSAKIVVPNQTASDGFRLGIRVYRSDVDFTQPLLASLVDSNGNHNNTQKAFGATWNVQAPVIEMTTDIASDYSSGTAGSTSYNALCNRFGNKNNNSC